MSPIDRIFQEIFGYSPSKRGTAYEMLSCVAEHLMNEGEITHDKRLRGNFSQTLYQIDVLSECESGKSMGEAKDYTTKDEPVGRGDLQKLGGALPDLSEVVDGKFFSATGYTAPAKQYAKAAQNFPNGKPIHLYEFRPSTELDEEGTIKTVRIGMHFIIPRPERGSWHPHFTEKGKEELLEGKNVVKYQLLVDRFYDEKGKNILSLQDLTSGGYGEMNQETKCAHGCFLLPNHFIATSSALIELRGLEYKIPLSEFSQTLEITDDSMARFVIKNSNGDIIRFITDDQIKQYKFSDDGELIAPVNVPLSGARDFSDIT
ncbi:hypothetical protein [Microbulbifer sp. TRSA007]|uniref:hypothetical protein n=1 Tax=Microbulbifer sp. TRSA007 TaxID=3243384 RepID=UPI00403A3AB0